MKYRTFPKLPDVKLSQFGMGLMRLPTIDGDSGNIDKDAAAKMVDAAIAGGVNYFDTAHPYHGGASQRFAAEYIVPRIKKDSLHLATKLPQWEAKKYEDYDRLLNEQLSILGLDQIEFYLIHALGDGSWERHKKEGVLDFLDKALADGRIKYPCFSFHGSYDVFTDIIDSYDKWIFAQIQLNYVDENVQAGVRGLKYAASKNVGIVIMEPLKGGMLVNNLPPDAAKILREKDMDPVGAAMKWCYNFKEAAVVLSGVSTLEQAKGQIAIADEAMAGELGPEEAAAIEYARDNFNLVPCSACQYCQPCPFGVRIPDIISMYNGYVVFGRENAKKGYQRIVSEGGGADQCTECGACEEICPQSIKIIDVLKQAHEAMA